jgi:DNA polymerase
LRDDTTGISRLHGRDELRVIGSRAVRLYPLYHPAAALYTPSTLETLRSDFQRIPQLLEQGPPPQPAIEQDVSIDDEELDPIPELDEELEPERPPTAGEPEPAAQLGLF